MAKIPLTDKQKEVKTHILENLSNQDKQFFCEKHKITRGTFYKRINALSETDQLVVDSLEIIQNRKDSYKRLSEDAVSPA